MSVKKTGKKTPPRKSKGRQTIAAKVSKSLKVKVISGGSRKTFKKNKPVKEVIAKPQKEAKIIVNKEAKEKLKGKTIWKRPRKMKKTCYYPAAIAACWSKHQKQGKTHSGFTA